jgi:hypothetical protein
MLDTEAYELSRIFRQGWNAAKKQLSDGPLAKGADVATLNPYSSAPERLRWTAGYEEALSSPVKSFNTPGGSAWRPAKQKRDF